MGTKTTTGVSYILHALAGAMITVEPFFQNGIPLDIQTITLGALFGMAFKLIHDYAGY